MIIPNGHIRWRHAVPAKTDPETGFSGAVAATWGDPVECQYVAVDVDRLALSSSGEHVTSASYRIYLDEGSELGDRLRLFSDGGDVVGEFSVRWREELRAVCEVRLWV